MVKRPKNEPPTKAPTKVGASGLPNLDDFGTEATSTRRTETNHRVVVAPSSQRRRPTLTVLEGFDAGRVIAFDRGEIVIGRGEGCDLALQEAGVSRRHAKLTVRDEEVSCEDLGSKNGTFVDGVLAQKRLLRHGDIVHVGPNVTIRFALMTKAEERLARDLFDASMRDPLTRAFNRRYFLERLTAEFAFAARHKTVFSVVMFDLDHFKELNDTYGHAAGDAVLHDVVAVARTILRSEDVLARIGGEEFVFLLRGIHDVGAVACADRVRLAVDQHGPMHDGATLRVTISAGVATSDEADVSSSAKLLALADERLYLAKAAGRNRVCGATPR